VRGAEWRDIGRDGHEAAALHSADNCVIATVGERGQEYFWQVWSVTGLTLSLGVTDTLESGIRQVEEVVSRGSLGV
jgi:hypothetical protein